MSGYICVTLVEQNMLYFLPTRTDSAVFRKENNLGGRQAKNATILPLKYWNKVIFKYVKQSAL